MCRIWIDGVPPAQQPAPTDCATAVRNRPANGRVIFGDDAAKPGKLKPKKFKGVSHSEDDGDERYGAARRRVRDEAEYADRRRVSRVDAAAAGGFAGRGSFPDMMAALDAQEGRRTDDVSRWVGGSGAQASPRLADLDGDGVPERAMWFDAAGQLVQVWTDRDRDGRADRIELFESGRRVSVVGR